MNNSRNEMSACEKSNRNKIAAGQKVVEELKLLCRDPQKYNNELLMRILNDNKDTEYGKRYGFADIHSVEDFQNKVPVTKYDDYAEYIIRMTEDGEQNLITSYPINHYNKSSGTMGTPKRIPMSDAAMEQYNRYMAKGPYGVMANHLDEDWIAGRVIRIAESTAEEKYLPCGASYGAVSQKMTRQFRSRLNILYTSPDEALFPVHGTNTKYLHARYALTERDAGGFLAAFYSYLIELLRYIENNWEMLVNDIENGTIDETVEMSGEIREKLLSEISPDPERAAELRDIFSQGFNEPFVPKVWKKLRFINGIGTGGFKIYADMIKERYTGNSVQMLKLGIGASEGFFSFPYELNREDTCLIPDSVFYEFLPLDAGDDFSKIVTIDGLEQGKEYELIITNLSGFYRYRMRDAIRVVGKYENTPTIEFMYRIDQTISIMGEKTTEEALRLAANETSKELGFELIDFSVWPDMKASPVRYQYFMEIGNNPDNVAPKVIRMVLEEELAKANPSMGQKVKDGICGDTRLNFLEKETYALYRDRMVKKGIASSQLKPVRVISNEMQRKFFFRLTEYSVEVMK
ncbi:MAG: GH3 auxin-responsive promoter family protein [Lachnospiraceae bacterium]|nr:GH3 auxin-responsive promoter family protein [Lachnospiraceae bacterium]